MITVHKDEAAWLYARKSLLTASDCACLLGVGDPNSPWFQTPDELFAEKVGLMPSKTHSDEVEQYRQWGHKLEPILRKEYAAVTGYLTDHAGDYAIVTNDRLPWFGATLDLIADHPTLGWAPVQIKNVGYSQRPKWLKQIDRKAHTWEQLTPLEKQVQCQAEIFAYGAKWAGIGALIGGNTFITREILRDDDFIDNTLLPVAAAFHERVEAWRRENAA